MGKNSKKLSLKTETVRVLTDEELAGVAGGAIAQPTTTVLHHRSIVTTAINCSSPSISPTTTVKTSGTGPVTTAINCTL